MKTIEKTTKKEYETPAVVVYMMASTCSLLAGSGIGDAEWNDREEEEDVL